MPPGDFKYQFMPELVNLPSSESGNDENGHGVCKHTDGSIFFTFVRASALFRGTTALCYPSLLFSLSFAAPHNVRRAQVPKKVDNSTQVLMRCDPSGANCKMLGKPGPEGLSAGTPHGLRIEHDEKKGESYLYHSNNNAKIMKTDLEGNIIWTADLSGWAKDPVMKKFTPQGIRPCDAIVVPGTDILLMSDGYGSSFVHQFNKYTGKYIEGKSFGGLGNTTSDPIKLHTPHGIALDPRYPGTVVISDRSNSRLVWTKFDGTYVRHLPTGATGGMSLPCNVDVMDDKKAGKM